MTVLDLTDRYHRDQYAQGGIARWTLNRGEHPYRAIALHHAAGWYGPALGPDATQNAEIAQIDAMARDHAARGDIGIGPAYNYLAFPSSRLYAVGKVGTHRAHTKGRNPATGERWNVEAVAICAMGNLEVEQPTNGIVVAIEEALREIRGWSFSEGTMPLHGHGLIPTVNSSSVPFPQATSCPGRNLIALIPRFNQTDAVAVARYHVAAIQEHAKTLAELLGV